MLRNKWRQKMNDQNPYIPAFVAYLTLKRARTTRPKYTKVFHATSYRTFKKKKSSLRLKKIIRTIDTSSLLEKTLVCMNPSAI